MFNVMSNNQLRAARELAAPLVQGEKGPIVFAEKRPRAGKGGAAFKSLTAAVKAAEREKEEARGYKLAADKVLEACCGRLREMEDYVRRVRRCMVRDAVVTLLMMLTLVVYMWLG